MARLDRPTWTCPTCAEVIEIDVVMVPGAGPTLRVTVPESALADAFAHVWAHHDEGACS